MQVHNPPLSKEENRGTQKPDRTGTEAMPAALVRGAFWCNRRRESRLGSQPALMLKDQGCVLAYQRTMVLQGF